MGKKGMYFLYIFIGIFLAACGSEKTTGISSSSPDSVANAVSVQKISRESILAGAGQGRYMQGELLVKFKSGVATKQAFAVHKAVGISRSEAFTLVPNLHHVTLAAGHTVKDAIVAYMNDPSVEYAEPNYIRRAASTFPNDPYFNPQQWALNNTGTFAHGTAGADVKMPQAWDITRGNRNVVVAVVDTGIDYTHPDLVNNIWTNQGETSCTDGIDNDNNGYIDDCKGWDFSTCALFNEKDPTVCDTPKSPGNDPRDGLGHGTHVAGIIGAAGNNGTGIAGMMWDVRLMAVKFLNDAQGEGTTADAIKAVQYAVANGAKVINASYGGGDYSAAEFDAINSAATSGVLFVAAAGNGGGPNRTGLNNDLLPSYPASYNLPNIISVAATDQNDHRASFSNFGSGTVHVAAPGVYILSTITPGVTFSLCTESPLAGYEICSGTSMAAPHVSGLAGLLYSAYPSFTMSQVRSTILRYVDPLPDLTGWVSSGGRINAYKALSSLLAPTDLVATSASSASITLSWKDNATGEDGYKVERKSPGGGFVEIANVGADSATFTDTGLSPSSTYAYRVKAYNTIPAESLYSNEASAATPAPTTAATAGDPGGGGGCSIGARQNAPTAFADMAVLLIPIVVAAVMRRRR